MQICSRELHYYFDSGHQKLLFLIYAKNLYDLYNCSRELTVDHLLDIDIDQSLC